MNIEGCRYLLALLPISCTLSNPLIGVAGGTVVLPAQREGEVASRGAHREVLEEFEIQQHEVTVEEYGECVAAGECPEPDDHLHCNWEEDRRSRHPITCVSYSMADRYCKWRGLELPTESEWSWVARNGARETRYPWGEEAPSCRVTVMAPLLVPERLPLHLRRQGAGCGREGTWPVGTKRGDRTMTGVADMGGNVYELVLTNEGKPLPVGGAYIATRSPQFEARNRLPYQMWWWLDVEDPEAASSVFVGFRCVSRRGQHHLGHPAP